MERRASLGFLPIGDMVEASADLRPLFKLVHTRQFTPQLPKSTRKDHSSPTFLRLLIIADKYHLPSASAHVVVALEDRVRELDALSLFGMAVVHHEPDLAFLLMRSFSPFSPRDSISNLRAPPKSPDLRPRPPAPVFWCAQIISLPHRTPR